MIRYIEGDIFSSPAQVIVNTVNTVGVMGKGIALEFKKRYPRMFEAYKIMCEKKDFKIGKLALFYEPDHWILLFPTKENWRYPSKIEYIEKGLDKFVREYAERGISSIAFPKLGCGNGELSWDDVKPLMEKYLKPLPIDIYIYLKNISEFVPEHKATESMLSWLKANAKDLSYTGLVENLSIQSALLPITFEINGEKWFAWMKESLKCCSESKSEQVEFSDEQFYEFWDKVRNQNICIPRDKKEIILFELLLNQGYVSKVKIILDDHEESGYQLNCGIGRAYSFKERL